MMNVICKEIQDYIDIVRKGSKPGAQYPVCKEQIELVDLVERAFEDENIYTDTNQLHRYLNQQKYFPFELLPWEKFCFALQMCTYNKDTGLLRFPNIVIEVGRGAGKNGYESFKDFCLITPINGVKNYNVDIFATSEDQAKTSFEDIYDVLENNKAELGKYFYWNKEYIKNYKTGSQIRYHTSGVKTKDGGRPGAITFDEYHAYENYKLIDTCKTGLGKKKYPRQTIITTNGYVRGGPLDDLIDHAERVLSGEMPDNGTIYFICKLDNKEEVNNPTMWHKANPSLRYFKFLQQEIEMEYNDFLLNPTANSSFIVKRMNIPEISEEQSVTSWENIKACKIEIPNFEGCEFVVGIDYMKTTDFLSAGLLFKKNDIYYWYQHSWVCKESVDLPRIKPPLHEWEDKGFLTFVDGPEISPSVPAEWLEQQVQKYIPTKLGLDNFRYTLLAKALKEAGFDCDKGGSNNIMLMKRVTQNRYVPVITSLFNTHRIVWGDDPMMPWYTNNACILEEGGNQYYGKKEAKSRKTDGFMALVAAICASEDLRDCGEEEYSAEDFGVYSY